MLVRVVDGRLAEGRAHPADGDRRRSTAPSSSASSRRKSSRATVARGGRGGLRHRRHQGAAGRQGRRHDHAREEAAEQRRRRPPRRCRASRRSSRRCSPASTRSRRASTTRCATRSRSSSSTTRRCTTSPRCRQALGFGFRCGFLGLLHMEIVQERLEREYDQDLITTAPTVVYQVLSERRRGASRSRTRRRCPTVGRIEEIREPIVTVHLYMPQEYVGAGDDAGQPEARRAEEHGLPRPPGAC